MPTLQVLILMIDKPYNPNMVRPTLDANAIEDQSTTNKPTVEILNAYTIDYFYKTEEKERFEGRYRWRWTDSLSRKIQGDGSFVAEDGLVFDFASYDVKMPSMQMLHWTDVSDGDNPITKEVLRQSIDDAVSSFDGVFESFNSDPGHPFRLELLAMKDFDETTSSRFAMVRKSKWSGSLQIPVWTRRYWWEIKEVQVDGPVGTCQSKTCYPDLLMSELEQGKDGLMPWSVDIPM